MLGTCFGLSLLHAAFQLDELSVLRLFIIITIYFKLLFKVTIVSLFKVFFKFIKLKAKYLFTSLKFLFTFLLQALQLETFLIQL